MGGRKRTRSEQIIGVNLCEGKRRNGGKASDMQGMPDRTTYEGV